MKPLEQRLAERFESEICHVCVHHIRDHHCTLAEQRDCPIFEWATELADLVKGMHSDRLVDYEEQIQQVVCPQCSQAEDGSCEARTHLNCPIDLYLGIVVAVLEEELDAEELTTPEGGGACPQAN